MTKKGKKYQAVVKLIDKDKIYPLAEAVELVSKTSTTAFDATVEVHLHLGIDPKKSEQQIRTTVSLPHGTGNVRKVAVFAEGKAADEAKAAGAYLVGSTELIAEIKKTGKTDFDIAVAAPEMMKELATVAKILGPKGLMPNPKSETVTPDVVKAVKDLAGGKIAIKNDRSGNIHLPVGKVSFGSAKLKENIDAALEVIRRVKPEDFKGTYIQSLTLATTMGPGVKVQL